MWPMDGDKVGVLEFHDSGHASTQGLRSEAGRISFLTDGVFCGSPKKPWGVYLSWASSRIKRVARSTSAEKSLYAAHTVDSTSHLLAFGAWTLRREMLAASLATVHVVDCFNLVQHLRNINPNFVRKRIAIHNMAFNEMISTGINKEILWEDTKTQTPNSLTKVVTAYRSIMRLVVIKKSLPQRFNKGKRFVVFGKS